MSFSPSSPLEGRIALVTGAGRPRGIGRSIALALADAGADVVVTDVGKSRADLEVGGAGLGDSPADLEESARLVRQRGRRSLAVTLDVTDEEAVAATIDRVHAEWGIVDVLVNNAGTAGGTGPFLDLTDAQLGISWQVNVLGQVHMARAALPRMIEAGRGSIVNVASTMGLARLGISEDTALEAMLADIPLGRAGTPHDIGTAVAWLVGEGAGFVNGAVVPITGGQPAGLN